jgi:hypothetical protein
MRNHVILEPASPKKRRQLEEIRNSQRYLFAIWTMLLGACAMAILAVVNLVGQVL